VLKRPHSILGVHLPPLWTATALAPVLQCVAVCCSVLQCVTVCCSALQCVAVRFDVYSMQHTHTRV